MADDDEVRVKGAAEDAARAAAGAKLFEKEEAEFDSEAAAKFKEEMDAKIATLQGESAALTGKDNKKARQEKDKEIKACKDDKMYIDAQKIAKGLPAPNGNFLKKAGGPSAAALEAEAKAKAEAEAAAQKKEADEKAKKDDKPKKAQESAGISKAERDELEKLKTDIIARKTELKAQGLSGGQQNKDEQIVAWVTRMNELKEKENPGCLAAAKSEKSGGKKKVNSTEKQAEIDALEKEINEYKEKLINEFKYSKKDIAGDPEMQDLQKKLKDLQK